MKHIDGLQWPDHNPELDDLSLFVKGHDIDAIDHNAIDLALKLQHRVVTGDNFLGIGVWTTGERNTQSSARTSCNRAGSRSRIMSCHTSIVFKPCYSLT